jgi:hypothetical protein
MQQKAQQHQRAVLIFLTESGIAEIYQLWSRRSKPRVLPDGDNL